MSRAAASKVERQSVSVSFRQTDRRTDGAPPASGGTDKLLDFALSAVGVAKRPEIKIAGLRDEHSGGG